MKDNKKFLIGLIAIVALVCVISLLAPKGNNLSQQSKAVPQPKSGYEIEKEMRAKITPEYLDNIVKTLSAPHFEHIDSIRYVLSLEDEIRNLKYEEDAWDSCHYTYIMLIPYVYGKPKIATAKEGEYNFFLHGRITNKNIDNPFDDLNRELEIYESNTHAFIYSKGKDLETRNKEYKQWERCQSKEKTKSKQQSEQKESSSSYSNSSYSSISSNGKIKTGKTISINATCIGAIDEATLDDISKSVSRGDEGVMKVALASGYAIVVQQGTSATIVSIRTGKVRVKLSDGRMVWVLYKHVK